MKKCFNCGAQIADDSQFCTECGKQIPQGNVCSHCGALVNNGDIFCQNCGSKVDGQQSFSATVPDQKHCPYCGTTVSNDSLFCEKCGRNMSNGSSVFNMNSQNQVHYETENNSQSKLILPIVIGLLVLALVGGGWWYYNSSKNNPKNNDTIQEFEDTTAISVDSATSATGISKDDSSNPYIGKTYKGSGNGGGLYTEMTITFLDGNKCRCTSDWYQAYSNGKTITCNYAVKNGHVIIHCIYDEFNLDLDFEVRENGRVLSFNNSDYSIEGTIGRDYMTLELSD